MDEKQQREDVPDLRQEERRIAAFSHLSTVLPIWGLVANGVILFLYRESSRLVCLHARQGILYQLIFLAVSVVTVLLLLLARLLAVLEIPIRLLEGLQVSAMALLAGAYALGLYYIVRGTIQALRGRTYLYPFAGKQAIEHYLNSV